MNGLNQMVAAALGTITYDARGNTVTAGNKTYSYDVFNQLTATTGTAANATMTYDPVGRLASVTGSGITTKFGYSGTQMVAEYNTSGAVLRRYVHGAGTDEPIVWYEGANLTTRKYYQTDNQGSVTAITDGTGTVTAKNKYNEYGVPDLGNVGRFQYTGQVWLAEAQIYHYKARAYDPYLGRFLQTDPIGYAAGMNIYAYVGGDPVNYNDPSGLEEEPVDEVIVTAQQFCPKNATCLTGDALRDFLRTQTIVLHITLLKWISFYDASTGEPLSAEDIKNMNENAAQNELCSQISSGLNRQSPSDPFVMVKVTNGTKIPKNLRPTYTSLYQFAVGISGAHDVNRRYPFTGLHLGSEEDSGREGLYLHDDFYDPTTGIFAMAMHGIKEVGPLKKGLIDTIYLENTTANRKCLGLD